MRRYMLGFAFAITSCLPTVGKADDQQIADFVKSRLQAHQQQGQLRGFNVDMTVDRGIVRFAGHVSNSEQEALILQTAQQAGHLGVVQIVDDIEVFGSQSMPAKAPQSMEPSPLQNVSYQQPAPQGTPVPQMKAPQAPSMQPMAPQAQSGMVPARPAGYGRSQDQVVEYGGNMPMAFAETNMRAPAMDPNCPPGAGYGGGAPMGGVPMGYGGAGMGAEAPNLPGYAWPGYAAHPNYGQVNYPKQYSASAWPYIGPFYPYPQVPLGWRKVSLQWDDGWWFLDFHDKCSGGR